MSNAAALSNRDGWWSGCSRTCAYGREGNHEKIDAIGLGGVLLAGCATAYQPESFTGGFSETQLAPDVFRIQFRGNAYTDQERAQDFALLRASELTLNAGYRFFVVANATSSQNVSAYTTPGSSQTTGNINRQGGFNATTTTNPGQTIIMAKPKEGVLIQCLNQQPPDRFSFDAAFVQGSLKAKYQIP